jgi:hypothetical protein
MSARRYSESQWGDMIGAYLAGATQEAAAAIHGASRMAIQFQLQSRGIPIRPKFDRPTVDETRFRDMGTEEEAYWLGFLYTDGCLCTDPRPVVRLSLAQRDREHVHEFARFLGARHAPTDGDYTNHCPSGRVRLTSYACQSPALVENLMRQGMHPRKTWTITPWVGPPELMRHFWRGCIDGDGCICYKPKRRKWEVSLAGNEAMCRGLSAFVAAHTGRSGCVVEDRRSYTGRMFSVRWDGNPNARAVASLLYSEAGVSLARKREAAAAVMVPLPAVRIGRPPRGGELVAP